MRHAQHQNAMFLKLLLLLLLKDLTSLTTTRVIQALSAVPGKCRNKWTV